MSHHHNHRMTRRDFIKVTGIALGGMGIACGGGSKLAERAAGKPAENAAEAAAPVLPAGEAADTVLVNGNIVTINDRQPSAKALAVKDGKILYVGDEKSARSLAGANSVLMDLKGRTVTPGLIDAHCHMSACGLLGGAYVDVNWPAVFTVQEMQQRLAERIAVTPPGEWVIGMGWVTFDGRYPNKHDLDPISPNHPLFITSMGGHMAVVNSRALELAGITADTPDPGNGRFLREANGQPDGTVMNHPAMDYFRRLWSASLQDVSVMEDSIFSPQARFAAMGVTSFQDVYARGMERMQAYFDLAARGEMTIRGQVMNVLEYIQELEGRIDEIQAMRLENDFMHFAGAKFQLDGAAEASFTLEPHSGIAWNIPIWQPQNLNEAVRAFHDAGLQVSCHTIGDAAVDMALNAIEAAMNANPRPDPRHRIEHAILNSDSALQRTKDLGIVISTQPTAIRMFADGLERIWGPERVQRMVPTRTWLDMGVPVCLSSDAPSMPWWDPMSTLYSSIVRVSATKKPVSPDQALTMEEAIYCHTLAGAYADFAENTRGSLEAGKLADLIVWHDDPYSTALKNIPELSIDLTMVGGRVVHQA